MATFNVKVTQVYRVEKTITVQVEAENADEARDVFESGDTLNLRRGYTQEQLEEAFDLVKPATHWKDHIDATVPQSTDMEMLEWAVIYFTGAGFYQRITNEDGTIRVMAPGYWEAIGA